MDTPSTIRREKSGRVTCTVSFSPESTASSEENAIRRLGASLHIDGFRKGSVPSTVLKERIDPGKLFQETVRGLLPSAFAALMEEHGIKPIISPSVEIMNDQPLTIQVVFVERPSVRLKGVSKISVQMRKPNVEEKDLDRMMDEILKKYSEGKTQSPSARDLTDAFVKEHLHMESVEAFRKQVKESMIAQEGRLLRRQAEEDALEQIRKATKVELVPELIEDEKRALLEELMEQLKRQNMSFDDWTKRTGEKPEEVEKDLETKAQRRLTLRLGIAALLEEKDIDITDDEMEKAIGALLSLLSAEERLTIAPRYAKGEQAYEQLRWQKRVEKLLGTIIEG